MASITRKYPLKIGDKTYELSPLNDIGREALDEWVRSRYIKRAKLLIEELDNESDKRLALKVAFEEAASLTWLTGKGAKMIATIEGMIRMIFEGIRINHPDLTIEEFTQHTFDQAILEEANAAFDALNRDVVEDGDDDPKAGG